MDTTLVYGTGNRLEPMQTRTARVSRIRKLHLWGSPRAANGQKRPKCESDPASHGRGGGFFRRRIGCRHGGYGCHRCRHPKPLAWSWQRYEVLKCLSNKFWNVETLHKNIQQTNWMFEMLRGLQGDLPKWKWCLKMLLHIYFKKTLSYEMPQERSVDIDTEFNFKFAEFLYKEDYV